MVLFGPGGVGKGTVADRLVADDPTLRLGRSWTTRPRRPGEAADAYVFVDRPTFEDRAAAGGFFEWAEFLGNLYGTPTEATGGDAGPAEGADSPGGTAPDTLLEIDLQGARQVRARRPDALLILLEPPSAAVQEARLRARGDDEEHIRRRLDQGIVELAEGRELADEIVVNDQLDRAVTQVAGILAARRASRA